MSSEANQASRCIGFRDWTRTRVLASVSTNAGSDAIPFQDWRHVKEAFTPELIELAFSETPGRVSRIVDPFGGSGTTALAAQFLGIEPTTIEVNPFLADLIEAKLEIIDTDRALIAYDRVVERVSRNGCDGNDGSEAFPDAPRTFVEPGVRGRFIFYKDVADRIVAYRKAIASETNNAIRRLFRVVLAAVTIPVSNVVVSGKGRRYRGNWKKRRITADSVDDSFRNGVFRATHDLRSFSNRRCTSYTLLRGDARKRIRELPAHDLAVFSPPYLNSFDYTDVYNIELWSMGYLDSRKKNTELRRNTLRSHLQISRDMSADVVGSTVLTSTVRELKKAADALWNRNIPAMVSAYMADMETVISGIGSKMRAGGRIYLVVGDSCYAGVVVPVATILAEISSRLGFRLLRIEPCRSIRQSPQQGGNLELTESLLVLERYYRPVYPACRASSGDPKRGLTV